jgi:glycosyltransferase involved in cell wall biosynthesis
VRILVAHDVPLARSGGMSRIMGFLHDRVAAAGHEVEYFTAEEVPPRLRGRIRRFGFPALLWQHVRARQRGPRPYQVVNAHEPVASALSVDIPLRRGLQLVVTSHGVERRAWELEKARAVDRPSLRKRIVYPGTGLWQSELSLRRADHVFCLNEEDRRWLVAERGRAPGSVTRIFPGALPLYAEAAAARDWSRGTKLLFAGTWRTNKGIHDLVAAFEALHRARPDVTLTVLGAGFPAGHVLSSFPEALRPRVEVTTARGDEEAAGLFARHDVFVLPSLFEGTPLTLMEALMSGLPVVTTATCGMRDVVESGRTGLLVPPGAPGQLARALESLVDSADLRGSLGRAAAGLARARYTWDAVAGIPLRAYEALVPP